MDSWCDFWTNFRPHANKATSQQTKPPSEQATWVRFGAEDDLRTHDHGCSTLEGFGFNPQWFFMISGWSINQIVLFTQIQYFLTFNCITIFITTSQQTEETTNRYVTTNFSAHVVVTFSVISIFQLRIANWPHHPRFGLAECARRVSIKTALYQLVEAFFARARAGARRPGGTRARAKMLRPIDKGADIQVNNGFNHW